MSNYSHFRDVFKFLGGSAEGPDHLRISALDSSVHSGSSAPNTETFLVAETIPPDRATPLDDDLDRLASSSRAPDATILDGHPAGDHQNARSSDRNRALVVGQRPDRLQSFNQANSTASRNRYELNNAQLKSNIHAVAGALTTLDAIENKLLLMRADITGLVSSGRPLNRDNVELALRRVTQYINDAIEIVDSECVNLLRDARMKILFTQLDGRDAKTSSIHLTMISPQKFLDRKLAGTARERMNEVAIPDFINSIHRIVSSNIQILSTVLLVLFATRDYTEAVTQLAQREGIIPRLENASPPLATAAPDHPHCLLEGSNDENLKRGRASLFGLLETTHPASELDAGAEPDPFPAVAAAAPDAFHPGVLHPNAFAPGAPAPDAAYVDRIALAVCQTPVRSDA